jgi:type IV pilus assembly protein PilM
MAKLFYTDKPITGLDISTTGIKIMSIDPKKWLVLGYGSLDLDPEKIKESLEGESDYLAENIKLLLREKVVGTLTSNQVAVSLPTAKSYSRTFTLPSKVEGSMQEAVELEAEQYIPIPVNTLYIDYEVIDRKNKETTVLMSAIPKVIVDRCLMALEGAELMPILIEPSVSAVARILNATEEGHLPTVIVDIGPTSTDCDYR